MSKAVETEPVGPMNDGEEETPEGSVEETVVSAVLPGPTFCTCGAHQLPATVTMQAFSGSGRHHAPPTACTA